MNRLLKLACRLGLVEAHVTFDSMEDLPNDVLIIPSGSVVEGQLHTNLTVVVAGEMNGSINIKGDASLTILEHAEVRNGLVSANTVEIHGTTRDVAIDVDRVHVSSTGRIEGNSQLRYGKLSKHEDAPINGQIEKRKSRRDGFAHLVKPADEFLIN